MKKQKFAYFFFLILVYMICSAKSCTDEKEMVNQEFHEQIQLIEDSMLTDSLDNQSLQAFEEKAIQKIIYFGELSSLIYNHKIDSSMQNNAIKQMTDLFLNDNVTIDFSLDDDSNIKSYTVTEITYINPDPHNNLIQIDNNSFQLLQPLYRKNQFLYHGKLQFIQTIQRNTNSSTNVHPFQVDFYIKKIRKQFGTDSMFIWQVFLGDIEIVTP